MTDDFPRTARALERGTGRGLHIGGQLYVSQGGSTLLDHAFGESRRGVAMRPESMMRWLCCTKLIGAVTVAGLWERGQLDLDEPVSRHVPAFAGDGRDAVTPRHLLTHTAPFERDIDWIHDPYPELCAAATTIGLSGPPGSAARYTVGAAWLILGMAVESVTGQGYEDVVRRHVLDPLGLTRTFLTLTPAQRERFGPLLGQLQLIRRHRPPMPAVILDSPAFSGHLSPGVTAVGPIRELGRVLELLANGGVTRQGTRVLQPETVERVLAAHRVGLRDDHYGSGLDLRWGLGIAVDHRAFNVPHTRPVFGHEGVGSVFAMADPERGLVIAAVLNGILPNHLHYRRRAALLQAIYADLHALGVRGPATAGRQASN